jgi:ubiquinone/menaquinone biosynthesis C-methylase UbiE
VESLEKKQISSILDVGTATGEPLRSIIDRVDRNTRVLGIDIVSTYLKSCQALFADYPNVEIRELNFYALGTLKRKFSAIIFGSSFMLMPDNLKALEIAKDNIEQGGSIFFLQTLYTQKNLFTWAMEFMKPYLYYLTTVDFGEVTYMAEFEELLASRGFRIRKAVRAQGNLLLSLFNFMMVEAELIQ